MIDTKELRQALGAVSPEEIEELLDRLEAAEKERDNYKFAFSEYSEKTEWVQQGINDGTVSPKYLGWHRADVMSDLLSAAEKERDNLRLCVNEWLDKTEWVQDEMSVGALPAKYLGRHRVDILTAEVERLRVDVAEIKGVEFTRKVQAAVSAWRTKCERLETENAELRAKIEAAEKNLSCCQAEREEAAALFLSIKTRLTEERDALRAKVERMTKRLHLLLEEPENTMSNSKALREMVKQARLALEESK